MKPSPPSEPDASPPAGLTLEAALRRLEEIAARLEAGTLDLEPALGLYREARELHGFCVARLAAAERELQILMADGSVGPEGGDAGPAAEG
jgi:exodeoxyribonuclease VII small subunit